MKLSPNDLVVMKLLNKQPSIYTKRERQKRHVISVSAFFGRFLHVCHFKHNVSNVLNNTFFYLMKFLS